MVLNASAYMIADEQVVVHVPVFPQSRINTIPHTGRQNREYMNQTGCQLDCLNNADQHAPI